MSTTSISSHRRHEPQREDRASLAVRTRVALGRETLTRELSAGARPGQSPELALRASQLVNPRRRRQFARSWRRAINEARQPAMTRALTSIIRRGAVVDAEVPIDALIARLNSGRPVAAQGMAMLSLLLTDGGSSPLYTPAEPGTLRREILVATEALDSEPAGLPLAA